MTALCVSAPAASATWYRRNGGPRDRVVAEEQQLAGLRTPLRVRSHRPDELAVEIPQAFRFEFAGDLGRESTLPQREELVRVGDDVGVGGVLEDAALLDQLGGRELEVEDSAEQRRVCLSLVKEPRCFDPPVPVARSAPVEVDGVDHPVAVEPVVATQWCELRVGAVAHVHARQLRRDLPGHGQVVHVQFVVHRGENAGHELTDLGGIIECRHSTSVDRLVTLITYTSVLIEPTRRVTRCQLDTE